MLRPGQAKRVPRELPAHDLAVRGHDVDQLGADDVLPRAARNVVASPVEVDRDAIVPRPAEHDVSARPAVEEVGTGASLDTVVAPESKDRVGAPGADQAVGPGRAGALGGMSRSEHHDCTGSDEAEHETYRHGTFQGRPPD